MVSTIQIKRDLNQLYLLLWKNYRLQIRSYIGFINASIYFLNGESKFSNFNLRLNN